MPRLPPLMAIHRTRSRSRCRGVLVVLLFHVVHPLDATRIQQQKYVYAHAVRRFGTNSIVVVCPCRLIMKSSLLALTFLTHVLNRTPFKRWYHAPPSLPPFPPSKPAHHGASSPVPSPIIPQHPHQIIKTTNNNSINYSNVPQLTKSCSH